MKLKLLILPYFFLTYPAIGQNFQKQIKDPQHILTTQAENRNIQDSIINDYTPVLAFEPCRNSVMVEDASEFNIGDTVLIIQMQGAKVDSTNSPAFGDILNYENAGNYEFNYISGKIGNELLLKNKLTRTYDIPYGKVQLVRVPYYINTSTEGRLTCLAWDGSKGGILVFNVAQTATLGAEIDVSGKGFRSEGINTVPADLNCGEVGYYFPFNDGAHAGRKGEGIATILNNKKNGRGKLANAGGGGNAHNAGGGGGGNGGTGGWGGYQLDPCNNVGLDNRGFGGNAVIQNASTNKIFMGGSGGAGHANNPEGFLGRGGNGGGIVIIKANKLISNGFNIKSNGANGEECGNTGSGCHEGMGGGGAGGTILLDVETFVQVTNIETSGGKGADMLYGIIGRVGPGGGGGGGSIWFSSAVVPNNVITQTVGGIGGVCVNFNNDPYGTSSGSNGLNTFNLNIPFDETLFVKGLDSVGIEYTLNCTLVDFEGLGYSQNPNSITAYHWDFGDGTTSNLQNPVHNYPGSGNYTAKLVVIDINGCSESIEVNLDVLGVSADAGNDASYCTSEPVVHILSGQASGATFSWSPAAVLDDNSLLNPTATITTTTKFYLTTSDQSGCTTTDSVTVNVNPIPALATIDDMIICENDSLQLLTTGTATDFVWTPAAAVNNSTDPNPWFTGTTSTQLIVTGSTAFCEAKDTVNVLVNPIPNIQSIADTSICSAVSIQLTTNGGLSYSWQPNPGISDLNSPSPTFSWNNTATIQLIVTGTDMENCSASDTINVNVVGMPDFLTPENVETCLLSPVQLNGNNGNGYTYSWSPVETLSNPDIINPMANPTVTTTYNLTVMETRCGFNAVFPVTVTVNPLPTVRAFKSSDIDCSNPVVQLSAIGAASYSWSPATGLSDDEISNPTVRLGSDGSYIVTGTNSKGCVNTDSISIQVTQDNPPKLFIPNTFTPNKDGLNDCFGVAYWSLIDNFEMKIFNRFGDAVFQTTDINACWNGVYKGGVADIGNYVYFIRGKTACGPIFKKGNLLLLR